MYRTSLVFSSFALSSLVFMLGCGSGEGSTTSGVGGSGSTASSGSTMTTDSTAGVGGAGSTGSSTSSGGNMAEDFAATAADFTCLLKWDAVRRFRITNKLGHQAEALAVSANTNGGVYPVGTIIQLVPFEAMVKRRVGFNVATKDWEFFALEVSKTGTTIKSRGAGEVTNPVGVSCLNCHSKAMPQWDLICEQTHGCDPIPFTADQVKQAQDTDPRCP
jgi:hypothetical protein